MSKPKYRAYKPVTQTDGILTWNQDTFDNTVGEWTDDDIDRFQASLMAMSPNARITAMQARLDSLAGVTPMIKMYADAIRAILAGLDNHHSVTTGEARELARAGMLWEKIIILRDVMPKAVTGAAVCAGGKKGGIIRGKQQRQEKAKKDEIETIHGERGLVSDTVKRLALKKDSMGDYLDIEDVLWPELIGILDGLGSAKEACDESRKPLRIDYKDNNGKHGKITFNSFRTMVYTERGKYK